MRLSAPPLKFKALDWSPERGQTLREAIKNKQVLFVDIDTQNDFIFPQRAPGKGLPVPGAMGIVESLKKLTSMAWFFGIPVVATKDTHRVNDPEFQQYGFDEHCVYGTEGWEKIEGTIIPNHKPWIIPISTHPNYLPDTTTLQKALHAGKQFHIEKNTFSVFEGNPLAETLFRQAKALGIKTAVVYGVATDYCVKAAVAGLKKLGLQPIVVQDAVKQVANNELEVPDHDVYGDVPALTVAQLGAELEQAHADTPSK